MRATGRHLVVGGTTLSATAAMPWVATPASGFAHDKVANPYLHALTIGSITLRAAVRDFPRGRAGAAGQPVIGCH